MGTSPFVFKNFYPWNLNYMPEKKSNLSLKQENIFVSSLKGLWLWRLISLSRIEYYDIFSMNENTINIIFSLLLYSWVKNMTRDQKNF